MEGGMEGKREGGRKGVRGREGQGVKERGEEKKTR